MRGYWNKIICAPESRMDSTVAVERFKDELRSLFASFWHGTINQLAFFPAELRTPIMNAGRTQTLLRLTYEGIPRLVEPYSLALKWSKAGAGQEYLYVWDQTGGSSGPVLKSLFNWKISSLENTDIKFELRYEIELAKAGEYGDRTTFASARRPAIRTRHGPARKLATGCAAPVTSASSLARLGPWRCARIWTATATRAEDDGPTASEFCQTHLVTSLDATSARRFRCGQPCDIGPWSDAHSRRHKVG
jgi:hypothetical protein